MMFFYVYNELCRLAWSYSLSATQKMIAVTSKSNKIRWPEDWSSLSPSKQWIWSRKRVKSVNPNTHPFLSLAALTTDIEHAEVEFLEGERDFDDSGGFDTCSQKVRNRWLVVWPTNTIQIVQKILGRIIQLILIRTVETILDSTICPQPLHCTQKFITEWLILNHIRHEIHHSSSVCLELRSEITTKQADLSVLVAKRYVECDSRTQDSDHGLDSVAVDNRSALSNLFLREAIFMEDSKGTHAS